MMVKVKCLANLDNLDINISDWLTQFCGWGHVTCLIGWFGIKLSSFSFQVFSNFNPLFFFFYR